MLVKQLEKDNISKIRLEDYYPNFKKNKQKPKQDYDYLKSYLFYFEKIVVADLHFKTLTVPIISN